MVIIVAILMLCTIFCYNFFFRKLYWSEKVTKGNYDTDVDKLMIVAHPGDELIFGGSELVNKSGWFVVCITNGSNRSGNKFSKVKAETKRAEFISVMKKLKCKYEIWDYEDSYINSFWHTSLEDRLRSLLSVKFKKIVTYDSNRKYNHIQHKKLNKIIKKIDPPNLYVFSYNNNNRSDNIEPNKHTDKILNLLKIYDSRKTSVKKYLPTIVYQTVKSDAGC